MWGGECASDKASIKVKTVPRALYWDRIFCSIHLWWPSLWEFASLSETMKPSIHHLRHRYWLRTNLKALYGRPVIGSDRINFYVHTWYLSETSDTSYLKFVAKRRGLMRKGQIPVWEQITFHIKTGGGGASLYDSSTASNVAIGSWTTILACLCAVQNEKLLDHCKMHLKVLSMGAKALLNMDWLGRYAVSSFDARVDALTMLNAHYAG